MRWRRPRRIFVCSMTDLFEERVPESWIAKIFNIMREAEQHTFQVLTKRAERMQEILSRWNASTEAGNGLGWVTRPLPNVWLGVSVENQARADERIPWLLKTPATVRFLSVEPMLGPVDLRPYLWQVDDVNGDRRIDWVIVGGESGGPEGRAIVERGYGPGDWLPKDEALGWVRWIRDQCRATGVACFFKQWGGPRPTSGGRILDGRTWDDFPPGTIL